MKKYSRPAAWFLFGVTVGAITATSLCYVGFYNYKQDQQITLKYSKMDTVTVNRFTFTGHYEDELDTTFTLDARDIREMGLVPDYRPKVH